MSRHVPLILITLLGLVAAACSGAKATPEATNAARTTASPTVTATAAVATAASGSTANAAQGAAAGAAAAAALNGKFCADWTQGSSKAPPVGGAPAPGAVPADFKASVETTAAFMKTLADGAPAEVKPDFQVLSKFWGDYATVMARNNFDFMRAATDPGFQAVATGGEGVQKANANIQAWMAKNCGR